MDIGDFRWPVYDILSQPAGGGVPLIMYKILSSFFKASCVVEIIH